MKRWNHWWKCKWCSQEYEFKTEMINHIQNKHLDNIMEENIDDTVLNKIEKS